MDQLRKLAKHPMQIMIVAIGAILALTVVEALIAGDWQGAAVPAALTVLMVGAVVKLHLWR